MTKRLLLAALLLMSVTPMAAQVVETPDGKVQVAGLLRRTPAELERMIQEAYPGTNLSSGACAAVLKHELGFADAAVVRMAAVVGQGLPDSLKSGEITLLLVVEPEDAGRVRYLPAPPDSAGPVPEWKELYERYPMGRLISAIPSHVLADAGRSMPHPEGMPDTIRVLRDLGMRFIEEHANEADRLRALEVVRSDRDWINRSIAAGVLSNFPEDDSTWWALAEIARGVGPQDLGRAEAIMALHSLGFTSARPVDWAPAAETLRAILDGTNLFAIGPLMETLTHTKISPDLADEVLGDGRFVLAYLRSPSWHVRLQAEQFLRQISGQDFGDDVERWEAWIESQS